MFLLFVFFGKIGNSKNKILTKNKYKSEFQWSIITMKCINHPLQDFFGRFLKNDFEVIKKNQTVEQKSYQSSVHYLQIL